MSAEFDTARFHEREDFSLQLPSITDRARVDSHLMSLGCTIEYESDFAYLPRENESAPWQSSDVTQIDYFLENQPSVAPRPVDQLNFIYLFATLPEETAQAFIGTVRSCALQFGGELMHRGRPVLLEELSLILQRYAAELRDELGDEPGSDFVARMLYEFKPNA